MKIADKGSSVVKRFVLLDDNGKETNRAFATWKEAVAALEGRPLPEKKAPLFGKKSKSK